LIQTPVGSLPEPLAAGLALGGLSWLAGVPIVPLNQLDDGGDDAVGTGCRGAVAIITGGVASARSASQPASRAGKWCKQLNNG